jgi:hypothetical protein
MAMNITAEQHEAFRRYVIEARDEYIRRQVAELRLLETWEPKSVIDDEDIYSRVYVERASTEGWPPSNHSAPTDDELRIAAESFMFQEKPRVWLVTDRAPAEFAADIPW